MTGAVAEFADRGDRQVSTLELFTDLVFVFSITQLTTLLSDDPTLRGLLEILLIFGVLWWMFGGYVYLTNAMPLDRKVRRLLLLVGMGGFLVMGLAIPTAFDGGGIVFGVGYAVVTVVHAGLFVSASGARLADVARFVPLNLVGAALVLAAGWLQATAAYVLFALPVLLQVVSSMISSRITFELRSGHFVERYGLLVLIVLGESIVAIGVGAAGLALDAPVVAAAILGLAVTSVFWWLYFSGDDAHAEAALAAAAGPRKIRLALLAFFYATIPMLLGVVIFAAGVKTVVAHPLEPMPFAAASALAAGPSLYLLGGVLFRAAIGFGWTAGRIAAAASCLLAIPIATVLSALAALASILAILVTDIVLEHLRSEAGRSASSAAA